MERDEQLVQVIKDVMKVLSEAYPDRFTEDGICPMGLQVMGILQQMLGPNPFPQGQQQQ